ncbi:MAG: hypothetical protein ABWZ25_17960 [Chitinophagaceae bacterium]
MEDDIFTEKPVTEIYRDQSVAIGTFVGGPLVAGYLIADNFKRLGQPGKVAITWVISVAVTLGIFAAGIFIPGIERIPSFVIPLLYTFIAHILTRNYQGPLINDHISRGGPVFSNWRAVGVGLIGLVIVLSVIITIAAMVSPASLEQ